MKKGFTKAWRKELDSDVWAMPPLYHRVWYWIRQKAQHETFLFPTPKLGIWILPGQRLTSLQQIAEGVKWYEWGKEIVPNKKTIKDIIDSLESWGMIEVESNAKGTLVTVVNWDTYNNVSSEESNAEVTPSGHKKRMKENEEEEGIESKMKRFIPPTLNEVISYCQERNRGVDPEKWFNFYEGKGWMVGKNKMKVWKAAVRTWEDPLPGEIVSTEKPDYMTDPAYNPALYD